VDVTTFAEKPASYTVNTVHAKCPDHLYMIDEGSGATLTDRGKTGGLNMTITNSTWTTDDLTAGGGTSPVLQLDGTTDYARTAASFSMTSNLLVVAIYRRETASTPSGTEYVVDVANSANNTDYAAIRHPSTTTPACVYDDSGMGAASRAGTVNTCDAAYHMVAGRFRQNGANVQTGQSTDGEAWTTASAAGTALWGLNRIAIGDRAGTTTGNEWTGRIAAVFVYKDTADPVNDWSSTFVSSLYGDPWQFLNVSPPDWSSTPSVSSQTATVYTVGFTSDSTATVYGVAVVAGSAAPSIAQVKAAQNGSGGAAEAANNKAVGLTADTLTLDMGGSPSPTYDLYFVLTNVNGDSSRQSIIGAPIGSIAFTVAASVTSQTTTAYTVGFTPSASCTVYGVAVVAGTTAPSVAQVKAGQNGAGAAAKASNSKAVTGIDSFTLMPSDSPAFPRYDLYCVLSDGGGDSAVSNLASEYLDAPAGKIFATLNSLDATSPFYGTGAAIADTCVLDSTTDPDGYTVACAVDGTVTYDSAGDDSRQLVAVDVYDYSAGAYLGAGTLVFNNLAPSPLGQAFTDPLLYQKDVAINTLALDALGPDPEGDTVTVTALDSLPTGLSITANDLDGTPTVYGESTVTIQWEDQYGATYDEDVVFQIGDLVPDVIGTTETSAVAAIEAVASLTTTVATETSTTIAPGNVISTSPPAGTLVAFDAIITLIVSLGAVDMVDASAAHRPIRHPGWQRKQAMDAIARERAMDRSIREALNPSPPAPMIEAKPPQRTSAQMAAEMASAQAARVARQRAVELGAEAQRARVEIERLQPELAARRQQASYRVIEQLLGSL
jgi:hypothetical protein